MYVLDYKSKTPLHLQLFEQLKEDIIKNYKVNERIPSIRKTATLYNLSKNTVESAYSQLVAEGYIESIPKSGYVVLENNLTNFSDNSINKASKILKNDEIKYDFFPARLEKDSFPLKIWKRLFNKVVNENIDLGNYSDKQGEEGLRKEISKYIHQSRGVKCNEDQIILGNGFINSMSLLALILNSKHNIFATENPGYYVARRVFENHKYKIEKIPVDKNGIDLDKLQLSSTKLVYVTPSHQYPTGVSIPIANRIKLLEWAKRNNGIIIEDDYDTELSYINRPIPSLQGLDNNESVVYIGTFSKALSPGLRVSYMVLPNKLLDIYKKNFYYYDSGVCLMTQKTLKSFIAKGYWDKHIRKIRTKNKIKHNFMKKTLEEKLGNTMRIVSQGGGLAILLVPTVDFDWDKLEELSKRKGIKLHYARDRTGGEFNALMMGFGGFKEDELKKSLELFSKLWLQCIIN